MVITAQEDSEISLGQLKRFTLSQLRIATENFSSRNEIGRGGFGKVYKGVLTDGTAVAVKRLREDRSLGNEQQFQTEVNLILLYIHRIGFLFSHDAKGYEMRRIIASLF